MDRHMAAARRLLYVAPGPAGAAAAVADAADGIEGFGTDPAGLPERVERGDVDCVVVEDDGPGIPAGEREAVFEADHTTAADGTGFGLAIVAEIVEAHGWEIDVTDGEAGGARFEITT